MPEVRCTARKRKGQYMGHEDNTESITVFAPLKRLISSTIVKDDRYNDLRLSVLEMLDVAEKNIDELSYSDLSQIQVAGVLFVLYTLQHPETADMEDY